MAVNYTNLRKNLKYHMDRITDNFETLVVTRKDGKTLKTNN